MHIIDIEKSDSITTAQKVLECGGIIVFPTDTVYGIGCLINNRAIKRLYKIKNRPVNQPTAILVTKRIMTKICSGIKWGQDGNIYNDFKTGKITVLFSKKNFKIDFPDILIKDNKIGIRLPQFPWLEGLINIVGPIVASSANRKGEASPAKYNQVDGRLIKQVDLVIKTDKTLSGKPSKVYDLESNKYLRN